MSRILDIPLAEDDYRQDLPVAVVENQQDSEYCSPDADFVLSSCDGTLFAVHSLILKIASSFFRDMLAIPRASNENGADAITVAENKATLRALLDIIYPDKGSSMDPGSSFELFQDLCTAADKYDMPMAITHMRNLSPAAGRKFPSIPVYGLMSKLGWREEMKVVSTETLRYNILSPHPELRYQLLSCDHAVTLEPVSLHVLRRTNLIDTMDVYNSKFWGSVLIVPISSCSCLTSSRLPISLMKCFLYKVSREMENCPNGDFLRTRSFFDSEIEFINLWREVFPDVTQRCSSHVSSSRIFDKDRFINKVSEELGKLPLTV